MRRAVAACLGLIALVASGAGLGLSAPAHAQDVGTMKPRPPAPPLPTGKALAKASAKQLFGHVDGPAPMAARSIGFYSRGCLGGGQALPVNGPTWQAMRLSRNRNWGHPRLIAFLERFAAEVPTISGWRGILVGDMSQPRGGPMLTGHASHQIGLDVDVWLTPEPDHELTREEREQLSATMMVRPDRLDIDPTVWRPDHWKVIRAAAQDPEVERVLVNAAIKKALCRDATGDRSWLHKVRPYWGHDYHMHIRLSCPKDSPHCRPQAPPEKGDGCGSELDWWFSDAVLHPKPEPPPKKPRPPQPQITLADLPAECTAVIEAK